MKKNGKNIWIIQNNFVYYICNKFFDIVESEARGATPSKGEPTLIKYIKKRYKKVWKSQNFFVYLLCK